MFHACAIRFDVTENLKNFAFWELNKAPVQTTETKPTKDENRASQPGGRLLTIFKLRASPYEI